MAEAVAASVPPEFLSRFERVIREQSHVVRHHVINGRSFANSFQAWELVDWLVSSRAAGSREEAVAIGNMLLQADTFQPVDADGTVFQDTGDLFQLPMAARSAGRRSHASSFSSVLSSTTGIVTLAGEEGSVASTSTGRRRRFSSAGSDSRPTSALLRSGVKRDPGRSRYYAQLGLGSPPPPAVEGAASGSSSGARPPSLEVVSRDVSGERVDGMPRDMALAPLQRTRLAINIVETNTRTDRSGQPFTAYVIRVTTGLRTWIVERRYKEFATLHRHMCKLLPRIDGVNFPGKKYLGSMSREFVSERRRLLQKYLREVIAIPEVWQCDALVAFLDNPEQALALQCNFVRMAQMQQSLTRTAERNKAKATLLESELEASQHAIAQLNARVAQLENLITRSAAGGSGGDFAVRAPPHVETVPPAVAPPAPPGSHVPRVAGIPVAFLSEDYFTPRPSAPSNQRAWSGKATSLRKQVAESLVTHSSPGARASRTSSLGKLDGVVEADHEDDADSSHGEAPADAAVRDFVGLVAGVGPGLGVLLGDEDRGTRAPSRERSWSEPTGTEEFIRTHATKTVAAAVSNALTTRRLALPPVDTSPVGPDARKTTLVLAPAPPPADDGSSAMLDVAVLLHWAVGPVTKPNPLPNATDRDGIPPELPGRVCDDPVETVPLLCAADVRESDPVLAALLGAMEQVTGLVTPTPESEHKRRRVFRFMENLVRQSIGAEVFAAGSTPLKTYLPDGDIDLVAFLPATAGDDWVVSVIEALFTASSNPGVNRFGDHAESVPDDDSGSVMSGTSSGRAKKKKPKRNTRNALPPPHVLLGSTLEDADDDSSYPPLKVRNVSFINADVKLVRCSVDNISVDIAANTCTSLVAMAFLESVDRWIGSNHLYKRSILAIKSWAHRESPTTSKSGEAMLGSGQGGLSAYALQVLILALFNAHSMEIKHPFHAVILFFEEYADFEWGSSCVTVDGPRHMFMSSGPTRVHAPRFVNRTRMASLREHMASCVPEAHLSFPFDVRNVNIVDPLQPWNNLGRSVSRKGLVTMASCLAAGRARVRRLLRAAFTTRQAMLYRPLPPAEEASKLADLSRMVKDLLFPRTIDLYNRVGWREDLLLHPLQENVWRSQTDRAAPDDLLTSDADAANHAMAHSFLVMSNMVTAPALCLFASRILEVTGPVPVGEVGKLLQDRVGNPKLSAILKEEFGGLKRFLLNHPDVFHVGVDHPFNPRVCLTRHRHLYPMLDVPCEDTSTARGDVPSSAASTARGDGEREGGKRGGKNRRGKANARKREEAAAAAAAAAAAEGRPPIAPAPKPAAPPSKPTLRTPVPAPGPVMAPAPSPAPPPAGTAAPDSRAASNGGVAMHFPLEATRLALQGDEPRTRSDESHLRRPYGSHNMFGRPPPAFYSGYHPYPHLRPQDMYSYRQPPLPAAAPPPSHAREHHPGHPPGAGMPPPSHAREHHAGHSHGAGMPPSSPLAPMKAPHEGWAPPAAPHEGWAPPLAPSQRQQPWGQAPHRPKPEPAGAWNKADFPSLGHR